MPNIKGFVRRGDMYDVEQLRLETVERLYSAEGRFLRSDQVLIRHVEEDPSYKRELSEGYVAVRILYGEI